jgi:hypothetical protein
MILREFFGKSIDPIKELHKGRDDQNIGDELFNYVIDHDKLHKDYFHPIAVKMKKANLDGDIDKKEICDAFMPMVKKGCKEYYSHKKLKGRLGKVFSKELRKDMCERLYSHYKEDIVSDKYKIGM